jgi:hypothetical protein
MKTQGEYDAKELEKIEQKIEDLFDHKQQNTKKSKKMKKKDLSDVEIRVAALTGNIYLCVTNMGVIAEMKIPAEEMLFKALVEHMKHGMGDTTGKTIFKEFCLGKKTYEVALSEIEPVKE